MRARSGPRTILFLAIFLSLALPFGVFARGKAEKQAQARLAEAEALIESRQYNAAILLLTDIVKKDADLFEAAEKLMNKIRLIKDQYNAKYEQMLKALFEDKDLARGLELIQELQEMDPFPNESVAKALEQARTANELVYNLTQFNGIMEAGAALIGQGRYAEAVSKYMEGFNLGRAAFDSAEYGNIIKNSVQASLEEVRKAADEFAIRVEELGEGSSDLAASLDLPDAGQILQNVQAAEAIMLRIAELQASAAKAAQNFNTQNQQIKEAGVGQKYDYFLFFAAQLAEGRPGKGREGIASAMGVAWQAAFDPLKGKLLQTGEALFAKGQQEYAGGGYQEAAVALAGASAVYSAGLDFLSLWPAQLTTASILHMDPQSSAVLREDLPAFLLAQERIRAARDYRSLIGLTAELAAAEAAGIPPLDKIPAERARLAGRRKNAQALDGTWRSELGRYRELAKLAYELTAHAQQAEALIAASGAVLKRAAALDVRLAQELSENGVLRLAGRLAEQRSRYEAGFKLQQGVSVALKPVVDEKGRVIGTPSRLEKYPARALEIYRPLAAEVQVSGAEADRLVQGLAMDQAYIQESDELKSASLQLADLQGSLAALQSDLADRIQEAEASLRQAEKHKQEGLLRLQQARNSVSAQRFAEARDNLQSAQEALDSSLSFQEDPEVRQTRDAALAQLSARIVQAENERVVREVRELINTGRRQYSVGDYNGAQLVLLKAKSRWADTNPQENQEVTLWLEWTRSAIQNISGREITLSNPLYTQMSQLYNFAYQDYQTGKKLSEEGRVREALDFLRKAEDRISQILIFFPYNSETRILSLRIAQLRDKEGFPAILRNLYNDALGKGELNPQEAYNTFKVLETISPNYPGLQNALFNLEIKLGLRIPPPDPAKIAASRRLFTEAFKIYQQNLRDLYPAALEKLNEAITLYPDNREATGLKDRIQIASGGTRQAVLSGDDQQRLREAERQYIEGNYLISLQIVNELLQAKRNQGYPPLLDLKKRIEAKL